MIPKIIHQIYFNWGTSIDDRPLFLQSISEHKRLMPDYKHILWGEEDVMNLIKSKVPQLEEFYNSLRYDIQRCDFARFLIMFFYGGFYSDLDIIPIKTYDNLRGNRILFNNPQNKERWSQDWISSEVGNQFWLRAINKCRKVYKEKSNMKIYDTWKIRFVFRTTGPAFLNSLNSIADEYGVVSHKVIWSDKWINKIDVDGYWCINHHNGSWMSNIGVNENIIKKNGHKI
jgi:mannosyltransferase OCH1-like enzyme